MNTTLFGNIQSVIRLYIPMHINYSSIFRAKALLSKQWTFEKELHTDFYLGYIKRIFNTNGIASDCLVLKHEALSGSLRYQNLSVDIGSARLFCFDTRTAFLELKFLLECNNPDDIALLTSKLRLSDIRAFHRGENESVCINDITHEFLKELDGYTLFDHLGVTGATRPEILASLIMDNTYDELNMHAYRIASGLDNQYQEAPEQSSVQFSIFQHLRWEVTDRGVCNIGVLTDNERNNAFICSHWFDYTEQRYVIWYILALHQKYALYRFLNEIAAKNNINNLKKIQEKIMIFNTKYRFSIISEEISYQKLYEQISDVIGLETEFNDIDDEVERITEYYESVSAKNNTISMTIISLICAVTVIREFYELVAVQDISQSLIDALTSLSHEGKFLYAIFCVIIILALIILIPKSNFIFLIKKMSENILNIIFRNKI